jgi:hypothetical protein
MRLRLELVTIAIAIANGALPKVDSSDCDCDCDRTSEVRSFAIRCRRGSTRITRSTRRTQST